jgi:hypothetical protein
MPYRSPLPVALGEAFTVAAALSEGVSASRMRARDLRRPFHGARTLATSYVVRDLAIALAPLLGPTHRFSHLTAAELHGMRLPEGRRAPVLHVTGSGMRRGMRRPGVVGHIGAAAVRPARVGGLPMSAPVDAWCECAELLQVDDLVVMADGLLARRDPVATVEELAAAVRRRAGRRGTARLRLALDLVRPGTDSARETLLRLLLVRAGVPEPEVNAPLLVDGRTIAHGDLVWPAHRLVVEYDGRHHAESPDQFTIDIRRLNDITDAGYRVIRVDRRLLASRADLLRRVRAALAGAEAPRTAM